MPLGLGSELWSLEKKRLSGGVCNNLVWSDGRVVESVLSVCLSVVQNGTVQITVR